MASLFTFENLYSAYLDCRRKKSNKRGTQSFEVQAEENLFALAKELTDRTYCPLPSFCFVSKNDKFREIFAAQFRDRVVHHLIVRYLEKIWEPVFIHDSYASRKGKGTHAAVYRLQSFARKITNNITKRAWYMKLDIRAFFPSIDRQLLLDIVLSKLESEEMRWLTGVILLHDPTKNAIFTCSTTKWQDIPPHKSLFSVPNGQGLPIGNLTSQFFANIYLNSLDQFIKHTLKVRFYIRYVDDFVLLHKNREQLFAWKKDIKDFLTNSLKLDLHPERQYIRPATNGIDFLGYIVRPSYLLIRRRIVNKCKLTIAGYQGSMMQKHGDVTDLTIMPEIEKFGSVMNSYMGAFRHAASHNLIHGLFERFRTLKELFIWHDFSLIKRWEIPFRPADLYTQYHFFRTRFKGMILFQVGCFLEMFDRDAIWANAQLGMTKITPRKGFYARCGVPFKKAGILFDELSKHKYDFLVVCQYDSIHGRVIKRCASFIRFTRDSEQSSAPAKSK